MAITTVDIPHNLGREVARQRLRDNVGDIGRHIPGGVADLQTTWRDADTMFIELAAMGQRVSVTLDIEDRLVRASFVLPGMLGFMAGAIAAAVKREGSKLLLPGPD
ncbi:MAG: polyhydroxyalkanoic acid system family protein [Polymorphobacter sp.]